MRARTALWPVAAVFVCFGAFWGTWAVAAADIEHGLHLTSAGLGLMLSGSVGAGGLAAAASGHIAERWGTDRFTSTVLVLWAAAAVLCAAIPDGDGFIAAFVLTMIGAGLVDMAMNSAAANAVGADAAAMVRFHGLFNAGALSGAIITGVLLHAGASWRWTWVMVAAGAAALSVWVRRARLPGAATAEPSLLDAGGGAGAGRARVLHSFTAMRNIGLSALTIAFVATASVEGGIDTWGVLYLRRHLAAGVLLGAGAYGLGQVIAVTVRGAGGGAAGRLGARWGLVLGAGVAAVGLVWEAVANSASGAAVGLVLGAAGISLCWPLAMSTASARAQQSGSSPAPLVSALTASGYIGWVAGPALVGLVADATSLRGGLFLLAGIAGCAAAGLLAVPATGRAR